MLYEASVLAKGRNHYEIAVEHFLLKALDGSGSDLNLILDYYDIDRVALTKSLNRALESLSTGNTGNPTFSDVLMNLVEAAWITASVDLGAPLVRSGAILLAYLKRPLSYAQGNAIPELKLASRDDLAKNFYKILANSSEAGPEPGAAKTATEAAANVGTGESFTAKFCEDFTAKAARGEIDPVFGRDQEIRSMVNILARRRKNNPIIVGDPGVGKTAVVEGLALRIAEGDVPNALKGVTLLALDIGLLEAGASVKGEFERRLKGVIDEVKASPKPIILFIDEAHALIGAGGPAGGTDAANLLKPALARGELKACAATTWKEYKKYFEKDAALARRFQLVTIGEPSAETCLVILRGLKEYYETSHGVLIRDEALKTAAIMADRYISGRYLPDKAVDLMDTACARIKVGLAAKPAVLEDSERRLAAQLRERDGLIRDAATSQIDQTHLNALNADILDNEKKIEEIKSVWLKQKEAAAEVIAARDEFLNLKLAQNPESKAQKEPPSTTELLTPSATKPLNPAEAGPLAPASAEEATSSPLKGSTEPRPTPPPLGPGEPPATPEIEPNLELRDGLDLSPKSPAATKEATLDSTEPLSLAAKALAAAQAKWREVNENLPEELKDLLEVEVTPETVAKIVSDWTGVPLGRLAAEEAQTVSDLERLLGERVKGQDAALSAIVKTIQASKAGLKDPAQPLGVFLMVGPSGVGKTETGLALADLLFGDEKSVISINMSEFQERHTVSRLVGSPPGYVGYGEGGLLTEAVRQKPYSVILLDECEKAHLDVMNIFYQVFDKGVLTDAEGKAVNFANTIILLTSNLAADIIERLSASDAPQDLATLTTAIRPTLANHFQPALLARMAIVPYRSLDRAALERIVVLKLAALANRVAKNNGANLIYDQDLIQSIADRCQDASTGARNIDHILSVNVTPKMAEEILKRLTEGEAMPKTIVLSLDENQAFKIELNDD
jgi:type VI secretion system protein VasG